MISTDPSISKIDPAVQRRRALAKVYGLLIRLAEESENKSNSPEVAEEKNRETSTIAPVNTSMDQADCIASQENSPA